ncbi:MAG TPA: glycerophosphodiester phosphodiesterase [Longimicrobiaceae bacterium]|nr:glycerophosphodiester phosphodiesterase [Longimicrobiaceae bacterium]
MIDLRPRPGHPYLAGAPLLIAHRGGSSLAPENTLLAFERALLWWRADLLELDVRLTRDGRVVVIHDSALDRTTNGSGEVRDHTLAQVQALDAGYRFTSDGGATFPFRDNGIRVPTLDEVLVAFPAARLNVEIKEGAVQTAARDLIARAGAEHRVLVAAGNHSDRSEFSDYTGARSASEKELRQFYICHRLHLTRLYSPAVDAFQMPERHGGKQILTPRLVRDAHAKNLAVHVWTVDEIADMERLLTWGVDGIVTDRPDRLARTLHARYGRPPPPGP